MVESVYLDHNATTPISPQVLDGMTECSRRYPANPASLHAAGRRARRRLEAARDRIAQLVGADTHPPQADRIIFTSGGTEANNLAIRGPAGHSGGRILISSIEHPSTLGAAEHLSHLGHEITRLPVDRDGVVDASRFNELVTENTRLVSVMLGNNETGVIQQISDIASTCRQMGIPFHTDAVQAVGKVNIDFRQIQADLLSLSAHKFHGPLGIGALVVRRGISLQPILFGGFQQSGMRPGTEPLPLIVGLERALEIAWQSLSERQEHLLSLRNRFEQGLKNRLDGTVINGGNVARLPHTSNISFLGVDRQSLLMALDAAGISCSTGSACSSGSSEASHVLLAMGCDGSIVGSAIRFSVGITTTSTEIDWAIDRISGAVNKLRSKNS